MFFKTKRYKKQLLYFLYFLTENVRKFFVVFLLTLLIFTTSSYADVILQGYQHIGDNNNISGYTPMDPVTNQQIENYPTSFHISDNLTVTAVKIQLDYMEIDDDKLQIFIDNTFVGEGSAGSNTVDITDQNLVKGDHSIAIRGRCINNGGHLVNCSSNSARSDNDINFSVITLVSEGTNNSINLVQRRHLGDNEDLFCVLFWCFDLNDWYDRNGQSRDPSRPYYYPDAPEGTSITFNFNVSTPVIIDRVRFFAAREIDDGANFYIDGTQKGSLQTNGNPYIGIENTTLYRGSHTFTIESINNDDISWDSISLIGTNVTNLDHILLTHDGYGLTCRAEPITVKACANDNCSTLYNNQVTVDFTNPSSGWETDPATFSGGQTTVDLIHTDNETITINANATSPLADNSTKCLNTGGGANCEIIFTDVGIIIDGNSDNTDPESNIITQIAGKPSDTNPNGETQLIRVIRTDDKTGACIPGVQNKNLDVSFRYSLPQINQGLDDNSIQVTANGSNITLTDNTTTQSLSLSFDSNGTAPFNFESSVAGKYSLTAEMQIPVTYSDNTTAAQTVTGTDTTNAFVVRPFAVFADADGNPKSQNAAGAVFKKAGNPFTLNFKSLQWTPGRDSDNNGIWDSCDNSTLDDPGNYYSRVPLWNTGQPAVDLTLPVAGNNPGINYNNGDVIFAKSSNTVSSDNITFGEVGIIQIQKNGLNTFLGESVQVCSPYIGRFTPHHFNLASPDSGDPFIDRSDINSSGISETCPSTFTYDNETFKTRFKIQAVNSNNNTTQNYEGNFAKLTNLAWLPLTTSVILPNSNGLYFNDNLTSLRNLDNGSTSASTGWTNGEVTITSEQKTIKQNNPIAPEYNVNLQVQPHDPDNVTTLSSNPLAIPNVSVNILYGILDILDNYGPETEPLTLPIKILYWNNNQWELNTADSCTFYISSPGDFELANWDNLSEGETTKENVIDNDSDSNLATYEIVLSKLKNEKYGSVDVIIDNNSNLYNYLWDNETTPGTATFGIYRGRDSIIEWKEVPAQ